MADRILIVEDDDDVRLTLAEALVDRGYEVLQAENGQRALELTASGTFALLLVDLMMPVMDGWTFIRTLRAREPEGTAPIVLLSAVDTIDAEAERLRVRDFLRKPFSFGDVLRLVRKYAPATAS